MKYNKLRLDKYFSTIEKTNFDIEDILNTDKLIRNINLIEINLNTLNYILTNNEKDFEKKIIFLFKQNKDIFKVIPQLLAMKENAIFKWKNNVSNFKLILNNPTNIIIFLKEIGFTKLIIEGKIKNFVDYFVGIEIGKSTNSRKNKNGSKNEKEINEIVSKEINNLPYIVMEKEKILDVFKNDQLLKNKRFDFVITNKKNGSVLLVETSYYNSSGSKINETSKSFDNINNAIKKYEDYYFIWIADGEGMKSIQKHLYNKENIEYIYNKSEIGLAIKEKLKY